MLCKTQMTVSSLAKSVQGSTSISSVPMMRRGSSQHFDQILRVIATKFDDPTEESEFLAVLEEFNRKPVGA